MYIKGKGATSLINTMQWKNTSNEVLGNTLSILKRICFYIFLVFRHSKRSHFDLIESNCGNQINLTSIKIVLEWNDLRNMQFYFLFWITKTNLLEFV